MHDILSGFVGIHYHWSNWEPTKNFAKGHDLVVIPSFMENCHTSVFGKGIMSWLP